MNASHTAALATLSDERELADFIRSQRQALEERWSPQQGGRHWMQEHTALLDAVLRRLFALSLERAGRGDATGIALIATGGYGQRLLAPGSDLDVTILAARDEDPPVLRVLFSLVMDVLLSGVKMKVGYAYRTFADIEGDTLDHQTQTALLDARYIAGDAALFARFDHLFHEHLQMADFLFRKEAERHLRRQRADASVYAAEPDIKNGIGGLRDLQTGAWMGRVRFHRPGEALWRDLVRRKVITRMDLRHLTEARELLLTVRCALHLAAGEQRDLLSRFRQDQVAARLGLFLPEAEATPDVQGFMRRYYTAATAIADISEKVVTRCLDTPILLGRNTGLSAVRRRVVVTEPSHTVTDPLWPLRALDYCQTYGLRLALATEEAIQDFIAHDPWQAEGTRLEAGQAFLTLLGKPGNTVETLRRMRRTSLLHALLPELDACMGLLPYDPSHIHTVGEHTLRLLTDLLNLRDGVAGDDSQRGVNREILRALDSPLPLYLGVLLHDTGKQWPTDLAGERRPHEETGAERAPAICARLGTTPEVAATVAFLVRQHLLLARVSRLRDLGQPATIREVARTVGDMERLRMLYLLTYADTKAVGPGVLSEMNARLLLELFQRTEALLTQEGEDESPDEAARAARLDTVRERLQRQLTSERVSTAGATPEAIRDHIRAMPTAYLLNTPLETMARHLTMVSRLHASADTVIEMRTVAPEVSLTEITVVTSDDPAPGLLAKLTGALLACDVLLHSAQVFTRDDDAGERIAIDTLWASYHDRPLGPEKRAAVEKAIRAVLHGEQTVGDLLARRRKPFTLRQPVRSFHVDDAAPEYTLLDVDTPDELGVVYRLATLLTGLGWNIHAARITVWGGHARCAFYLTDPEGNPLNREYAESRLTEAFAA